MTSVSDLDCDLTACPWRYPGPPAPFPGVLSGDRFTRLSPTELRHLDVPGRADRTAVVSVGANASPGIVRRKLTRHGVGGPVPFVAGRLLGAAVGHSAHVSAPGYIAAAPFLAPGASTSVVVCLLDERQVGCLDETEPNYTRRTVRPVAGPVAGPALRLDGVAEDAQPGCFDLYDGRWGVLAPPAGTALPFGTQAALHDHLRRRWKPYAGLLGEVTDVERTTRRLGAAADLRRRTREMFGSSGWTIPSGFAATAAGPG